MPKIMILGANTLQVPLIQQAAKSGYDTIVVSPQKDEPGFKYANYSIFVDVRDKETILKYAVQHQIVGIITDQTDIPVRTVAYVSEKMGLSGIGYENACLFTDKYLMREKCKELGIKTLQYRNVNNISDAIEFFECINSDVILKPIDNQGSKGVFKISTKLELIDKFNESIQYSNSNSILIEQFVSGREFVVEGIAYNNNFKNLICGDTHYFNIPDVFSATTRIFPSKADHQLIRRVEKLNSEIIKGFGLKQGISHSEFIMDGNDNIYLIETAARGGGVFISSDLISLSTNLNTEEFLISISTGNQKAFPSVKIENIASCYIAFYLPVGHIASLEGVKDIDRMTFTHRHNLNDLYIGKKINQNIDKTSRSFIIVSGETHEDLERHVKTIQQTLKIEVQTNSGIEGPIWN
ncbi:ATP-grasp domain-containing protein [Bacillus daqingensis]